MSVTASSVALFVLSAVVFLYVVARTTGPIGLVGGVVVHLFLGYGLYVLSLRQPPKAPTLLEFDIHKIPPPPPPPMPKIEAPKPPEPPKVEPPKPKAPKIVKPQAPIPNQEPPKAVPPAEPPKRIFGLTESSTTDGPSSFSVAVGNSTIANQNEKGNLKDVKPLPAAPPQAVSAPVFKPVSALEIKSEPDVDEESCRLDYPDGEAKQAGIEGDTLLRVEIDEKGKVHDVRLMKGVGHGLDTAAISTIKHRCKFTPARNTAGQAVAFVIPYTYHWVIDR